MELSTDFAVLGWDAVCVARHLGGLAKPSMDGVSFL